QKAKINHQAWSALKPINRSGNFSIVVPHINKQVSGRVQPGYPVNSKEIEELIQFLILKEYSTQQ
ncbi:MAG TPA: hypothetical protein PK489_08230, partial [Prolixibacteraceae bacterium]|nr:hypothetical protein [Prolixibacteraceae bacterium]